MRWSGYVVHTGKRTGSDRALVGRTKGKKPLEDAGVGGSIILELILNKSIFGGGGGGGKDVVFLPKGKTGGFLCKWD